MSFNIDASPVTRSVKSSGRCAGEDAQRISAIDNTFATSKRIRSSSDDTSTDISNFSKQQRRDPNPKCAPILAYSLRCCAPNTHICDIQIRQLTMRTFKILIKYTKYHVYILNAEEWNERFLPRKNRWKIECSFYPNFCRTNFVVNFARLEEWPNDRNLVEIQCMRGDRSEFQRLCWHFKQHLQNNVGQLPSQAMAVTDINANSSAFKEQTSPETEVKEFFSQFLVIIFNMICSSFPSTIQQGWCELAKLSCESMAVASYLLSSNCKTAENESALSHMTKVLQSEESDEDSVRCVLVCLANALKACQKNGQNVATDKLTQVISAMGHMLCLFENEYTNEYSLETRYRAVLLIYNLLSDDRTKKEIFNTKSLRNIIFDYQTKLEEYENKDELQVLRLQLNFEECEKTTTEIGMEQNKQAKTTIAPKRRFGTIATRICDIVKNEKAAIAIAKNKFLQQYQNCKKRGEKTRFIEENLESISKLWPKWNYDSLSTVKSRLAVNASRYMQAGHLKSAALNRRGKHQQIQKGFESLKLGESASGGMD